MRISSAEPISSTSASATSVTTRIDRALFCRKPVPDRPLASLSVVVRSVFELCSAGIRPKMTPVRSETRNAKPATRQSMPTAAPSSPTRGRPAVLIASSARMPTHPEDQAEHASRQRQHDALGEQLPDDAAARAADRGADGDFPPPAGRPHQQQIGDVGAGDQQHQADGAGQHHQRLAGVSHQHVADRIDREPAVRAERVRILALVLLGGCRNARLGLLE